MNARLCQTHCTCPAAAYTCPGSTGAHRVLWHGSHAPWLHTVVRRMARLNNPLSRAKQRGGRHPRPADHHLAGRRHVRRRPECSHAPCGRSFGAEARRGRQTARAVWHARAGTSAAHPSLLAILLVVPASSVLRNLTPPPGCKTVTADWLRACSAASQLLSTDRYIVDAADVGGACRFAHVSRSTATFSCYMRPARRRQPSWSCCKCHSARVPANTLEL